MENLSHKKDIKWSQFIATLSANNHEKKSTINVCNSEIIKHNSLGFDCD